MHPFTAILGFVAGSLVSLAFGLGVVLFVFWLLQNEHPRFAAELPEVIRAFSMFLILAVLAATGFAGTLRNRPWRYLPLALTWIGLLLVAYVYWPA
ncbi:MAG: hypothetical protein BroJett010_07390 [Gammaproteobacteria bacterium]|nr:hypothetical protein [Gammaproteobacteria bacterium]GIK34180.1 MAG: hypothetical protein BroJett010_07390 [Gammaproteobacteria bacterium]GJQ54120.1 MAG: hypothetical protein HKUEN07_06890 [Rhodocyclaceae bacterium]